MTRTIQQLFDLTGKTALVTGGSRGLGLQMAHALGEAGARIMLSSRKADDLEQACAELQAAGIDARWIAADCAKESEIVRLADETLQRMGKIVGVDAARHGAEVLPPLAERGQGLRRSKTQSIRLRNECVYLCQYGGVVYLVLPVA